MATAVDGRRNQMPATKKIRLTSNQRKALDHYKFCEREEDRLGYSVFANSFNTRRAAEKTRAAYEECKRLGMGVEDGL